MKKIVLVLVFFFATISSAFTEEQTSHEVLHGLVQKVNDGDTIEVLIDGTDTVKSIRVYGINCPERWQPYYREAKAFTKK